MKRKNILDLAIEYRWHRYLNIQTKPLTVMIKKTLILISFCSLYLLNQSLAQGNSAFSQSFGVNNFEVNYKECPFDKEANAVVFLDEANSSYNDDYNLITYHHVKLKILKDKGMDYGNISIPFYSGDNFETISDVTGTVFNSDRELTSVKLEKRSVYTKKINEYWSEVRFAFPDLKVGSIIEYYYTSIRKNYGGLKEWVFQKEIPVLKSRYFLTVLPDAQFAYSVQKSPDLPIEIKPDRLNGAISFEMDNIPGLRDEKYIDSKNDYLQKVSFQLSKFQDRNYMTSWDRVYFELTRDGSFYGQLKKDVPGTDDFIKGVRQDSSELDKMKTIYDYVRSNMAWNNIYSKYSPDGIKKAWETKTGTSGDVNLLLVNLLRHADLEAYPMLVSERFNGKVNPKVTMIDQFNSVYACVTIGNKKYFLDATNKYISCQLTPYPILNTTAFVVTNKKGYLISIADSDAMFREEVTINAAVNNQGSLNGTFAAKSFDYAKAFRIENLSSKSPSENQKLFTGGRPGLNLSALKTEGITDDRLALTTKSDFSLSLGNSSSYYFLPINLLSGLNENPFISDIRFSNINFGYKQNLELTLNITVDKNFTIEAIPRSIRLRDSGGDLVFTRNIMEDKQQNELKVILTFEINQNLYPADQYGVIKDFYKKLFELLKEQIVLRKN